MITTIMNPPEKEKAAGFDFNRSTMRERAFYVHGNRITGTLDIPKRSLVLRFSRSPFLWGKLRAAWPSVDDFLEILSIARGVLPAYGRIADTNFVPQFVHNR